MPKKERIYIINLRKEIQKSPTYNSGFALRFPRFTALRQDKKADDIATLEEVEKDFSNQRRNWKWG